MVDNAVLDTQKLEVKQVIILFDIILTNGVTYSITPYNDTTADNISLGSKVYQSIPMQLDAISFESQSSPPRPILTVSNIFDFADEEQSGSNFYNDILNAKVIKRQTFKKYIDKFNSDGTQATDFNIENSLIQLPKQAFVVDRIAGKNSVAIDFELSSAFDLDRVKVPGRIISGGFCPWIYKGANDSTQTSVGGCTWSNTVRTTRNTNKFGTSTDSYLPVYMNALDEYIVQGGEHFLELEGGFGTDGQGFRVKNSNDDIIQNRYYKTEVSGIEKINTDSTISIVNDYDYWQALQTIAMSEGDGSSTASDEAPADNSPFWRRVRIWKYYDPKIDFCAYVDKARNEYAFYKPIENFFQNVNTFSTQTIELDQGDGSTTSVRNADISSILASNVSLKNIVIEDENFTPLIRINNDQTYSTNLVAGLTRPDEYVLIINVVAQNLEVMFYTLSETATIRVRSLISNSTTTSAYYDPTGREELWQIAAITQEGEKHFTTPKANSIWQRGDLCGKALTSCALRFQAKALQYDIDEIPNAEIERRVSINPGSVEHIDMSVREYDDITVDGTDTYMLLTQSEYHSIPDTRGYVTAFFPNVVDPTLRALKNSPGSFQMEEFPDSNYTIPRYNISTTNGDIRLKIRDTATASEEVFLSGATLLNNPSKDFFGYVKHDDRIVSPAVGISISDNVYLEPVAIAYEKKFASGEHQVRFYRIPNVTLSALNPIGDFPSPDTLVDEGEQISLRPPTNNTLSYVLNNDVKDPTDTTVVAAAGTEYSRIDNPAPFAPSNFYLDFVTINLGKSGRSFYIATDRGSSTPLPFGGFPGTRRYN